MQKLCITALTWLLLQSAWAVELSRDGIGSVLLFPYYTTRGNNITLLTIQNTGDDVAALKLNFQEGDNGESVLLFNLYLGPFDTWTGTLSQAGSQTVLSTRDSSCTVPRFYDADNGRGEIILGETLLADLAIRSNTGRQSLDRTREGHINVIEMGRLTGTIAQSAVINIPEGQPFDCQRIVNRWDSSLTPAGIWTTDANNEMFPPGGDIIGESTIINVSSSRAAAYQAIALNDFYVPDDTQSISLHATPQANLPTLADAFPATSRVNRKNGNRSSLTAITDTWASGLEAVEAVLMAAQAINALAAEPSIGGGTEWVMTFPTKRAHVFNATEDQRPPFSTVFGLNGSDGACESFIYSFIDRNTDDHPGSDPSNGTADPPPLAFNELCYQTNVITYSNTIVSSTATEHEINNQQSQLLGSRLFSSLNAPSDPNSEPVLISSIRRNIDNSVFATGDLLYGLNFGNDGFRQVINPDSGNEYQGLPVIGINLRAAQSVENNAFFGIIRPHRYDRMINLPDD